VWSFTAKRAQTLAAPSQTHTWKNNQQHTIKDFSFGLVWPGRVSSGSLLALLNPPANQTKPSKTKQTQTNGQARPNQT